ncbi:TetR/AcrR family transcriptional regulator [Anaerocolumna xylanovorans]|uniref:Transcriptional regulator, TetR family n=1 Tax=Anaerocolumna xylanovorans DSM 12503 TaxID=1121345 RepID=A0A1M7XYB6_9FIRM|nr:TetR/AcrR family transcriptional regulator [Anaerocolumna xylanovorans]SHO44031.1 transcriptional regulator, TetR family [Anaerocolumna xylanovorans DSM 12503]
MVEIFTKEKFLEEGKKEFLVKGYKETSLRQICKNLGLTLGAFYGYFSGKEDLFDAIVSKSAKELFDFYTRCHKDYMEQDPKAQFDHIGDISSTELQTMVDYMYRYYDEFKLVFCRSSGTKYEFYLEQFIVIEVAATRQFLDLMEANGFMTAEIDDQLSHNLASMLFKGLIEIFEHDMPYEQAAKYVHKLGLFYTAGWMKLFEG